MRYEYPDQIDIVALGLNHQSCWKGIGASIKMCSVEDSSTDFQYDSEMKWNYIDYQILEDISGERDRFRRHLHR